jgi:hypothetical protein
MKRAKGNCTRFYHYFIGQSNARETSQYLGHKNQMNLEPFMRMSKATSLMYNGATLLCKGDVNSAAIQIIIKPLESDCRNCYVCHYFIWHPVFEIMETTKNRSVASESEISSRLLISEGDLSVAMQPRYQPVFVREGKETIMSKSRSFLPNDTSVCKGDGEKQYAAPFVREIMANEGVAVATIIGMIAIPATAHRGIIKFIGHFVAAASVAVNVSSQAYRSVAFNSAFTFRTTALYQIACCRIILRMKVIARGPAYLSSISRYKMIVSEISRWPTQTREISVLTLSSRK